MRWIISCLIVLGSVALWTVLPLAWVTPTAAVVSHGGARFIIVLFGCPLTMGLVGLMPLAVLEEHRRALSPAEEPRALLEPMLVLSGLIAVVGLVLWWFFVAESSNPSGPLQPI